MGLRAETKQVQPRARCPRAPLASKASAKDGLGRTGPGVGGGDRWNNRSSE